MSRQWLAGAAALLMIPGIALAQDVSTRSTTTTTTSAPPAAGSYSASESRKTVDADGTVTEKSRSYDSSADGTSARANSETRAADGTTVSRSREEHVDPVTGESSSSTTTSVNR